MSNFLDSELTGVWRKIVPAILLLILVISLVFPSIGLYVVVSIFFIIVAYFLNEIVKFFIND